MAQLKFVRVLQVALLSLVVSLGLWGFSSPNSNLLVDVVDGRDAVVVCWFGRELLGQKCRMAQHVLAALAYPPPGFSPRRAWLRACSCHLGHTRCHGQLCPPSEPANSAACVGPPALSPQAASQSCEPRWMSTVKLL